MGAGLGFAGGGDGVFEIEDDGVGAGGEGFAEPLRPVAGDIETGQRSAQPMTPVPATRALAMMVRMMSLVPSPIAMRGASR